MLPHWVESEKDLGLEPKPSEVSGKTPIDLSGLWIRLFQYWGGIHKGSLKTFLTFTHVAFSFSDTALKISSCISKNVSCVGIWGRGVRKVRWSHLKPCHHLIWNHFHTWLQPEVGVPPSNTVTNHVTTLFKNHAIDCPRESTEPFQLVLLFGKINKHQIDPVCAGQESCASNNQFCWGFNNSRSLNRV